VRVQSLGYRTDLGLLGLGGTQISAHADHLVVRSPHNPSFWWGNFLLLGGVPAPGEGRRWLDRFAAEFPGAAHVALGFDGVADRSGDLGEFAAAGFEVVADTVLTATAIAPQRRSSADLVCRRFVSDRDWSDSVELRMRCHDGQESAASYRGFVRAQAQTNRALAEAGHGAWFGAFLDGRPVAQMGLVLAERGLARFQSVETDPLHRRRGLARALLHHVCDYGFAVLRAETLVMVADPGYVAIDLYRDVGFVPAETQLRIERAPSPES
jgi:ribosomal protein S18 acetylase RimI-like enzyme